MIIGLTGSFCAGKGEVVNYLVERKGFAHYSATTFIRDEIVRRGLTPNRDAYIAVANDMRASFGPAYIVDSLYARAKEHGEDALMEAWRAIAEVRRIKELGGVVIGVDADPHTRYQRAQDRGGEKDNVSYEKWLEQEQAETNPDDPTKQDIFGALRESDFILQNNGTLEELHSKIEGILEDIAKRTT